MTKNERAALLTTVVLGALFGSATPGEAQARFRGWVVLYSDDQRSLPVSYVAPDPAA